MKDQIEQRGLGHVDEDRAKALDLLTPFCYKNCGRENITRPFSIGKYTYAADGRVIIRIPRVVGINESGPNVTYIDWNSVDSGVFIPLPAIPQAKEVKCMECQDGTGKYPSGIECDECDGTGRIPVTQRVTIGCNEVSDYYLRLVSALPGIMIGKSQYMRGLPFKFVGGDGMIMPMRKAGSVC